jgi:predicted DNA-binding protein
MQCNGSTVLAMNAEQARDRQVAEWAMANSLAGLPVDEAATAELKAQLPTPAEPVTPESTDAMLVTTSLRLPLGTLRRVQDLARTRSVKPTALMREWIEQMLAAVEQDRPVSLHDALRALSQLPASERTHPGA